MISESFVKGCGTKPSWTEIQARYLLGSAEEKHRNLE
jgi:hypothetical protein